MASSYCLAAKLICDFRSFSRYRLGFVMEPLPSTMLGIPLMLPSWTVRTYSFKTCFSLGISLCWFGKARIVEVKN